MKLTEIERHKSLLLSRYERLMRDLADAVRKGHYLNAAHANAALASILLSLLSAELKDSQP